MGKKVLFITYDGLTDPLGQSQILPYLQGLAAMGYAITILSCEKEKPFKQHSNAIRKVCQLSGIDWEYTFYHKKPAVFSTIWDLRRLRRKAAQLYKQHAFDILHCRSILPALIADPLRKKYNTKLLYDMRGFWADERVEGKLWNLNKPIYKLIYRYFKGKEKYFFETADEIVSLTESAKKYIAQNFNIKSNPKVIPCCVDLNHFDTRKIQSEDLAVLKHSLGINEDNYVLTYLGSLGTRYMLREMLLFFKALKNLKPSAKFLFISKSDTSEIKNICQKLGINDEDIIITSANYKSVPQHILIGDAAIFFILSSFSGKAVSPTKQAEVLSMGLPMVVNNGIGDTHQFVQETQTGVVLKEFTAAAYNNAAAELLELSVDENKFKKIAAKYFSLISGVEKYDDLYKMI